MLTGEVVKEHGGNAGSCAALCVCCSGADGPVITCLKSQGQRVSFIPSRSSPDQSLVCEPCPADAQES